MDPTPTPFEALEQALAIAGSQSELARVCGVQQPTVWKWLQSSKRIPAEHVLRVEAATRVPRHHLRPDIYPANLGPSPAWHGVDRGETRVCFQTEAVLHRNAEVGAAA